jgi:ABC-type nitrate/sulfonate/bicarbonate transport system permease component
VLQQPPPSSIVVRVVEQPVHETTISDVIFGSLGLVGVMLLAAVLMGVILGGGLILFKRLRRKDALDAADDGASLRVTPTS